MIRTLLLLLLLLGTTIASAQNRYIIRVFDNDNERLSAVVDGVDDRIRLRDRNLDFPDLELNSVVAVVPDPDFLPQLRNVLDVEYQGAYLLLEDPPVIPNEGSGDLINEPITPEPPALNFALEQFVPGRPISDPLQGPIRGKIIVDIIGTGIDQSHPDLNDLTFEPALSVMFASGGGFLPGSVDYHNHETRIAGCIAGLNTGLLSALGTQRDASYRSVLCYGKPLTLGSAVPTTFTSDCIAALAEILLAHEDRLATPYLSNHAAVLCFSHTVEAPNTRVGDLDALFDLAWERGIVTSLSAGNYIGAAAASSPAGAGEWVLFDEGAGLLSQQYWPPLGAPAYTLPSSVGFNNTGAGSDYHLKTGAHDNTPSPAPWVATAIIGSSLNTDNPPGFGPPMNSGVDFFAAGQNIPVPATRLHPTDGLGPITVDGSTYHLKQGYQTGTGTSYSAAFTAAVAARILQMRPWASPAQIRQAMLPTGTTPFELLTIPDLATLDPMSLTFPAWIQRYRDIATFGYFDGGLDDKSADPDHDGISNVIEYLCGMDPRFPDPQHAPQVSYDNTTLKLQVKMQLAAYLPEPAIINWKFQRSKDLQIWKDQGQGIVTTAPHTPANGDGVDTTGTLTIDPVEVREFYRVQISSTP